MSWMWMLACVATNDSGPVSECAPGSGGDARLDASVTELGPIAWSDDQLAACGGYRLEDELVLFFRDEAGTLGLELGFRDLSAPGESVSAVTTRTRLWEQDTGAAWLSDVVSDGNPSAECSSNLSRWTKVDASSWVLEGAGACQGLLRSATDDSTRELRSYTFVGVVDWPG